MEDILYIILAIITVLLIGRWLFKAYITEPQKDKKIGLYKFQEFSLALGDYKIALLPVKGSEHYLTYRENISNGVENIGHIDYSINDYINFQGMDKIHNYYFTVEASIQGVKLEAKSSGYISTVDVENCKKEIDRLRHRVINNPDFQRALKSKQLR